MRNRKAIMILCNHWCMAIFSCAFGASLAHGLACSAAAGGASGGASSVVRGYGGTATSDCNSGQRFDHV